MEIAIEDTTIDAAKSSLVYSVTQSLSSPGKAASSSFANQVLRSVPQDFGRQLLQQIQSVTKEQVRESIQKHISPLFDASSSVAVVVSTPSKTLEIKDGLESFGFEVETRALDVPQEELDMMDVDESDSGSESESGSNSDDSMLSHR